MPAEIITGSGESMVLKEGQRIVVGSEVVIVPHEGGTWVGFRREELLDYWGKKIQIKPEGCNLFGDSGMWIQLGIKEDSITIINQPNQ